mmetsp:Transcript_25801/g.59964  ORF Transcript_25801/g.59964 Transcript_25801/m.59964 type:complete len:81 (-) Transcript_25801:355-597(-)
MESGPVPSTVDDTDDSIARQLSSPDPATPGRSKIIFRFLLWEMQLVICDHHGEPRASFFTFRAQKSFPWHRQYIETHLRL